MSSATLSRSRVTSPIDEDRSGPPAQSAGRRSHTRIAVGLVVVVLCVLASVSLYGHANDRVAVLAIRRTVAPGQRITGGDIGTVSISSDPGLRMLAATQRPIVIGQIATVELLPGSLLSPTQISAGPAVPAGMAITGATLKSGQFPIGLAAGSEVMLVENPPASADGTSTDPVAQGNARVLDVESLTDASSSIAVSLVVPADRAAAIASAGANGLLALVVVRES